MLAEEAATDELAGIIRIEVFGPRIELGCCLLYHLRGLFLSSRFRVSGALGITQSAEIVG